LFPTDRSKKALGISLGEKSLLVAQAACDAAGPQVTRVAEFTYPEGVNLEKGEALGAALKEFLNSSGFTARRALIGVPAKWLVVRPHQIPPTDPATAIALLGIQVEAHRLPELGEIVYDFVGQSSETEATTALLMGLPKRWLDQILAMAKAARLQVAAVTPCTAVLGAATAVNVQRPLVLSVRREGAELAAVEGSHTRFLRHLGSAVAALPLGMELRRSLPMLPAGFASGNGHAAAGGLPPSRIVLWDDVGLDAPAIQSLSESLGIPVVRGELPTLGGRGCGLADGRVGGPAVALALPLLERKKPAIDFLHPRLVPPTPSKIPRRVLWISTATAAALLFVALGYADLVSLQRQVDDLSGQYRQLQPTLQTARPFVNRMRYAETFRTADPRVVACLCDVTDALPPDQRTYLTAFRLQQNMQGEFAGRSDNVKDAISVIDTLSKRFADIKRSFDGRGNGGGVSFKVTFVYVPKR
jgi:hypothetical protein